MRCMSDEPFTLDTNIIIYSFDLKSDRRHEMRRRLFSGQVSKRAS